MMDIVASNLFVRLAVLAVLFAAVLGAVYWLASVLQHRMALRSQLKLLKGETGAIEAASSLRSQTNDGAWARLAAAVEKAGLDLTDTRHERLTARLQAAGFRSPAAPKVFTLVRLLLVFALPLAYLLLLYSGPGLPSFTQAYVVGSLLALLGLYLPNLYVRARADRRRDEIRRGFPDCLDLMIVCVEAGLGIEAAMDRVGRELVHSQPLIAEMLSVTTLQLRAGASREEAFRRMADFAGIDEVRSFATMVVQSDKLGTSITATLRVYAAEMREKRSLRAEEKAHRLPVLISIPLVTCMLPAIIGVLMLPAVIRLLRYVVPAMMGE